MQEISKDLARTIDVRRSLSQQWPSSPHCLAQGRENMRVGDELVVKGSVEIVLVEQRFDVWVKCLERKEIRGLNQHAS